MAGRVVAPLTIAAAGIAAASAAAEPPDPETSSLSLRISAGEPARAPVCGRTRRASVVPEGIGARVRVRWWSHASASAKGPLSVALDRCSGGRWVRLAGIARRTARSRRGRLTREIPALGPGGYRLRAKLGPRRRRAFVVVKPDVVERPVSFVVRNSNRSSAPCPADGNEYRLAGRLTAPRALLERRGAAVTLLIHEFGFGKWFWTLPVPGYDFAHELARAGHASVALDRLGYDDSDSPPGLSTCLGAQADMTHQVAEQLRNGSYSSPESPPIGFDKVVLAGHSLGGQVAELSVSSFGGIDGLVLLAAADQGFKSRATLEAVEQGLACTSGGQASEKGTPGYAPFGQSVEESRELGYHDTDPAVLEAALALRNSDPCGDVASNPALIAANNLTLGSITVPVLLLYGTSDAIYEQPAAGQTQRDLLTGSPDVTLEFFDRTGHALVLERSAPAVRRTLADWLGKRGF